MKNSAAAILVSMILFSCTKSEVKTESVENPDGTVTIKTTEVTRKTGPDSAKINATLQNVKNKLDKAGKEIKEAAQETGAKIEKTANHADKKIQEETSVRSEKATEKN